MQPLEHDDVHAAVNEVHRTAYIYFRATEIAKTVQVPAEVLLDYDSAGDIVGMEVLWKDPNE